MMQKRIPNKSREIPAPAILFALLSTDSDVFGQPQRARRAIALEKYNRRELDHPPKQWIGDSKRATCPSGSLTVLEDKNDLALARGIFMFGSRTDTAGALHECTFSVPKPWR